MEEISANITIGGRVTRTQWEAMVEAEPLLDNYLPDRRRNRDKNDQNPHIFGQGPLELYAPQATWGHFEALEAYLQEQGIPYDRHADGNWEYDAVEASWRPGMGDELSVFASSDGDIVVKASRLIEWIRKGLTLPEVLGAEPNDDTSGIWLHWLRETDPVPPFEFVEGDESC